MKILDFAAKIEAEVLTGMLPADKEICGIYSCDLLSWVMSHTQKNDAWITVLTNMNVVAVASLTEVSCIVIPEGINMEEATLKRAIQEGITILSSKLDTYEICCRVPGL